MKRLIQWTGAVIAAVLMIGCGNSDKKSESEGLRIGVICSASGQNDNGYNQSACDGLETVAGQIGAEFKIVEPINGVPSALETMAEDGYDLIFSLEYDFDALIKGVGGAKPIAEQYPDTWFVIFNDSPNIGRDGTPLFNNVIAVMFNVHEASYLAGYLSVLTNENMDALFPRGYKLTPLDRSRGIGFIGGTDSAGIRVYSYGFMTGINAAAGEYDTSYDYYAKYDAGFTDPALGSTVAGTMYDSGANVVFADCGVVGDGVTARAREAGKIAIQTDADLDAQQPGHVVTSVLKITGVPVVTISKALADGIIGSMDKVQSYDLASGATGITDLTEMGKHVADAEKWAEIKARVAEASENIKSGKIRVVNAQAGESFDPASCPRVRIK
ncbi:MAG: BMP family ABC transporter substrate-binding protein [Treponema sp.]|jgi:basic membrane protein A|nr:BMP family ABC transporter substrate-binding protein [Treponema sp.]